MNRRLAVCLTLFAAAPLFAQPQAETASEPAPYIRLQGDFQTKIRTFKHPYTEDTVVLMGTVHLADESFYARFNREIAASDLVLLEGVSGSPGLGSLPLVYHSGVAHRIIDPARLARQGEQVPGTEPQCENADVTLDALSPGWGATLRGIVTLPFYVVGGESLITVQSLGDYTARLTGQGGAYAAWHRETLTDTLASAAPDDLPDSELILDKRNAVVLTHLDRHIAEDTPGRVLIPWGAAHGPGLESGLRERGYEPVTDEWVTAISVAAYRAADYTTPEHAYRFHVPLVFSVRGSESTFSLSGPLWLFHHSEAPAGTDSSLGWILYSDARTAKGEPATTGLAGLAYLRREKAGDTSSLSLLGLLRVAESSRSAGTAESFTLLGLHGRETALDHTRVRLGWWGSLFNHEAHADGDQTTSVLPHLFGRPLLYDSRTDAGRTTRRALLFFEW